MVEKEQIILETQIIDNVSGFAKRITKSLQTIKDKTIETTRTFKDLSNKSVLLNTKQVTRGISASTRAMREQNTFMDKTKKTYNSFGKVMAMPLQQWQRFNKQQGVFVTKGARVANKIRMMTHGLKGFRMAMLGVMFFGMAMSRLFTNMLKPVENVFGVQKLWADMLTVVFLPIMSQLMPLFIQFVQFMMNLPDPVKKAIGVFVLLGAIFGKILFIVGTLALGLGSLFQTSLPALLSDGLDAITGFFTGIAAGVSSLVAVIAVIIVGMVVAWKENFGKMKDWVAVTLDGLKNIFKGVFDVVSGIIKFFVAIMKGDFTGAADAIKQVWTGLKEYWTGIFKFLLGLVVSVGLGILRVAKGVIDFVKNLVTFVWDWGKKIGKKLADAIWSVLPSWLKKLLTGIVKVNAVVMGTVTNAVKGVFGVKSNPTSVSYPTPANYTKSNNYSSNEVSFSPTYNISVADTSEFDRILADHDRKLMNDIQRNV